VQSRAFILAILLLSVVPITPGQEPVQLKVDVQLVTLDVYVDTTAGKPVTNLGREDFALFEDGEPRDIRNFESAENPYNILLLFDRSSSTEEQWPFLVRSISGFMQQLPPQHRVALAAFDDKPVMLAGWKSAADFNRQGFEIGTENSGTDVYGALEWASQELRKVKGRKGVIVFTDGVDNRLSKKLVSFDRSGTPSIAPMDVDKDFQKVLRTLAQNQTPIYFVAVNTDKNPAAGTVLNSFDMKQREAARLRMESVANRSNGVLHLPKQIQDVASLYDRIGRELGHSYSLTFTPGRAATAGSYHRIEVRLRDGSMRATPSREGYYAQ
jgi:VWFA-related protein